MIPAFSYAFDSLAKVLGLSLKIVRPNSSNSDCSITYLGTAVVKDKMHAGDGMEDVGSICKNFTC